VAFLDGLEEVLFLWLGKTGDREVIDDQQVEFPLKRQNRPAPARNTVRHHTGILSAIIPESVSGMVRITQQGSDVIQSTIVNELLEADLVIADLTDHNPNVLFELGLRMAGDKPVALIKAVGTGRVFDVDNMLRVHEYQPHLWRSTVESDIPELVKHFKAAWENRGTDVSYMKLLRRVKANPLA
jgi:nucleoside 2-deoxyribosyltransferase